MKRLFGTISVFMLILVWGGAPAAAATSVSVQNGLNGYSGQTNDVLNYGGWGTWVDDPNDPCDVGEPTAAGYDSPGTGIWTAADDIDMVSGAYMGFPDGRAHHHQRCLIRFAGLDAVVPAGEYVQTATLILSDYYQYDDLVTTPVPVYIARAMQPWTDGDTYWKNWGNGGFEPGYTGIGLYQGLMDPNWKVVTPPTLEFGLDPGVVQGWVDDPCNNHGMLLYHNLGANWTHWTCAGQDVADPCKAPKLVLETSDTPPGTDIVTLQNGVNSYAGQTNDALSYGGWDWGSDTNAGYNVPGFGIWTPADDFELASSSYTGGFPDGQPHYHMRTLMRFAGIDAYAPAGKVVKKATLILQDAGQHADGITSTLIISKALQPWTDADTYWLNWGNGGTDAGYVGNQMYQGPHDPWASPFPTEFSYELDPAIVQSWVDDPASNHGMLIYFNIGAYVSHFYADGQDGDNPPQLVVEFGDAVGPGQELSAVFQNGLDSYLGQSNDCLSYGGWGYFDPPPEGPAGPGYDSPGFGIWTSGTDDIDMVLSSYEFPNGEAHYHQRCLIRFAGLEARVPAGMTITGATLELANLWMHDSTAAGALLNLDEALQPWTDGDTYWTNWGDGGRDAGYLGRRMASMFFRNADVAVLTTPLTFSLDPAVVQDWVDDDAVNHGMLLAHPVGEGYTSHWTADGQDGLVPPKLTLTYELIGDLDGDLDVDVVDLSALVNHWLDCTDPAPPCNYVP